MITIKHQRFNSWTITIVDLRMLKFNQRTTDIEKHFKIWGMSYGIWKTLENNGILYIYHQQLMIFAFKISQDSPNTKKFLFFNGKIGQFRTIIQWINPFNQFWLITCKWISMGWCLNHWILGAPQFQTLGLSPCEYPTVGLSRKSGSFHLVKMGC